MHSSVRIPSNEGIPGEKNVSPKILSFFGVCAHALLSHFNRILLILREDVNTTGRIPGNDLSIFLEGEIWFRGVLFLAKNNVPLLCRFLFKSCFIH